MAAKHILPAKYLQGPASIPGDKSISHRAAILGTLAEGETRITNFLQAQDCLATLKACQQMGAQAIWRKHELIIQGRGWQNLTQPREIIDCGNSGTGVRLLTGVLAGASQRFKHPVEITGDEQVQARPMQRVIVPLTKMGAVIAARPGGFCPLTIYPGQALHGIAYESPVASAQVKSCVLLAGLFAQGKTSIRLPIGSRQHTENMLKYFGVDLEYVKVPNDFPLLESITINSGAVLHGRELPIPADISSAAFFIVAAALLSGSKITIQRIGIGAGRGGILYALREMGAIIKGLEKIRQEAEEPVTDITVQGSPHLKSIEISRLQVTPLIDEIPILAVAGALAEGDTLIRDAAELRIKETDRISVLVGELRKIGVRIEELPDGMLIHGTGGQRIPGGIADSHGDHRLAMSLAVAGLVSEQGVLIQNPQCVNTSFPGFWKVLDDVVVR